MFYCSNIGTVLREPIVVRTLPVRLYVLGIWLFEIVQKALAVVLVRQLRPSKLSLVVDTVICLFEDIIEYKGGCPKTVLPSACLL